MVYIYIKKLIIFAKSVRFIHSYTKLLVSSFVAWSRSSEGTNLLAEEGLIAVEKALGEKVTFSIIINYLAPMFLFFL